MNPITIKEQNGTKTKLLIASCWEELTLSQLIQIELHKDNNVLRLFSILTGIPIEVPENSTDKNLEKVIWQAVAFLKTPVDWENLKPPPIFEIDGELFKTPDQFGDLMIGQKILIGQTVKDVEDLLEKMPRILAILFMPKYTKDKKFDSSKINELSGKILGSLGLESYAIAKGFFLLSNHLKTYGLPDLKKYQSQKTPTKKILRKWLVSNDSNPSQT